MLIEVIISAMLIGLIVVATFTGFDVANRTTADERSHAQADAIAQQWEERMRGEQVSDIAALNKTFCVNDQGVEVAASAPCPASVVGSTGTIFTVATTGKFISNTSGASSCSKESTSADYIQTTTTVKWPALGSRLPVSESSIVTPPVSGQLVVQDYNGPNPVSGVEVTATRSRSGGYVQDPDHRRRRVCPLHYPSGRQLHRERQSGRLRRKGRPAELLGLHHPDRRRIVDRLDRIRPCGADSNTFRDDRRQRKSYRRYVHGVQHDHESTSWLRRNRQLHGEPRHAACLEKTIFPFCQEAPSRHLLLHTVRRILHEQRPRGLRVNPDRTRPST